MRNIFILALILSANICLSQTKRDSILLEKVNSLEVAINKLSDENAKSKKLTPYLFQ